MRFTLASLCLLALLASPLAAQAPARQIELPRDSALFRALREMILPKLRSSTFVDSAIARGPLRFRAPEEGDPQVWRAFEREIADSLDVRQATALDRSAMVLWVGRAQIRDTIFEAVVEIGSDHFCGTNHSGDLSGYSIRSTRRRDGSWPPFVLSNESLLESFGCMVEHVKPEKMPGAAARIAWIRERYPCPAVVPHAWVALDKSLGKGFPCSLVAMAMEVARPAFDVACVRITSYGSIGNGVRPMDSNSWGVTLYGRDRPGVSLWIDPVSGETQRNPVVFSKEMQKRPPCRK